MTGSLLITLPPPTPNGGLHLGHLSGPFLSADVFYKYQRLCGYHCVALSFSDANQSYVRVTAERQRRDPGELARYYTQDILDTLEMYGADVDGYFYPDEVSNAFVRDYFLQLYEDGSIKKKAMPFFYSPERGAFLDEAGVSGYCPRCLAVCKCGICEACAFVNDASTLVAPHDTVTGFEGLELHEIAVLALDPEDFRDELVAFYGGNPNFRARYSDLVRDALDERMALFPVSVPGDWGIQMAHPDFPGQVVNAWAELMAQLLWGFARVASTLRQRPQVVNFFGFDNAYFYAVIHASLYLAGGKREWLPHATVNNEFYNLDHSKFSTSSGHVVWARDLAVRHSPDAIRFYAALNNPGFEKSNFNEAEMTSVVERELFVPWRAVSEGCAQLFAALGPGTATVKPEIQRIGTTALERIGRSFSLRGFHLRQATEDLLHLLTFIRERLSARRIGTADAAFLVKIFAEAAYPVMPFAGAELYRAVAGRPLDRLDSNPGARLAPLRLDVFERAQPASGRTAA